MTFSVCVTDMEANDGMAQGEGQWIGSRTAPVDSATSYGRLLSHDTVKRDSQPHTAFYLYPYVGRDN